MSQGARTHLDFVCELLDLVDGGVVLVGKLPELLLTALGHFLQVRALVLRVAQGTLKETKEKETKKSNNQSSSEASQAAAGAPLLAAGPHLHLGQLPDHLDLLLQDPLQGLLCRRLVVVLVLLQGEQLLADPLLRLGLQESVGVGDQFHSAAATMQRAGARVTLEYACS